jgi:LAO/AO transport system kinase
MQNIQNLIKAIENQDPRAIARAISLAEESSPESSTIIKSLDRKLIEKATLVGITGPPGAGKSSLTSKLIELYRRKRGERIGVIAIDPTSPVSGGAILGDRIRMMDHALDNDVVMRSMATRGRLGGLCGAAGAAARIMAGSGCSTIIIETVGVGQSEIDIIRLADITLLVTAPGLGDDIQAMKAGLLEVADLLVVNKADLPGADALAMDMESVAREKTPIADNLSRVCLTSAAQGKGIEKMLATIDRIDGVLRKSGEHRNRRDKAATLEILDWAMEMVRPRFLDLIEQSEFENGADPKQAAAHIVKKLSTATERAER